MQRIFEALISLNSQRTSFFADVKEGLYNTAKSFIKLFAYTKTFEKVFVALQENIGSCKNLIFNINYS